MHIYIYIYNINFSRNMQFSRPNQEEIENLNSPVTSMVFESVIKKYQQRSRTRGLHKEILPTFEKELITILSNYSKNWREYVQMCSIRSELPWQQNKNTTKNENYRPTCGGSDSKESACNGGDLGSIPGLERSPR